MATQKTPLTWGKCTITYTPDGGTKVTTSPRQGSTKLSATEGNKVEAKVEGGDVIATRRDRDSYTLEWEEYIHPANVDNHRARISAPDLVATLLTVAADDPDAITITAARANLHATFTFDTEGGIIASYKADLIKTDEKPLFEFATPVAGSNPQKETPGDTTESGGGGAQTGL